MPDDTEIEVEVTDPDGREVAEEWLDDPEPQYDVSLSELTNRQMLILHAALVEHHGKFQPLHDHAEDTRKLIRAVNEQNPRFSERASRVFEATSPPDAKDWGAAVRLFFDSPFSDRERGERFALDDMLWALAIALVFIQVLVAAVNLALILGESFGAGVLPREIPYATPIVAATAVVAAVGFAGAVAFGVARRRLDTS